MTKAWKQYTQLIILTVVTLIALAGAIFMLTLKRDAPPGATCADSRCYTFYQCNGADLVYYQRAGLDRLRGVQLLTTKVFYNEPSCVK